jgi:hypothetical protein
MKRFAAAGTVAVLLALGGAAQVWANHNTPPTTVTLPGGAGHLTYSVESRKGPGAAGVDCQAAANAPAGTECYDDYRDSKAGSGGTAQYPFGRDVIGTNPVNGGTCVPTPAMCTITWGGVYANTPGGPQANGRAWTGVSIAGVGTMSLAAGGGAADATGHPHGCVIAYAQDGTSGHAIAGALYAAGVNDDPNGDDADVQLCGVIGG